MDKLYRAATKYTPEVNFNSDISKMLLKGQSYPENTAEFYQPVKDWVKNYTELKVNQEIVFDIDIAYFNSSSSKVFMDILEILDNGANDSTPVTINWFYDKDDEIILEHGEEFKEDLNHVKFNLIAKDN